MTDLIALLKEERDRLDSAIEVLSREPNGMGRSAAAIDRGGARKRGGGRGTAAAKTARVVKAPPKGPPLGRNRIRKAVMAWKAAS
jgi:hypothetical protein